MDFAPAYLVARLFYRIVDFFHHWYIDGSRYLGHRFISVLQGIDRTFAIRITISHFFEPLYRDYSIIGRILGVIFRTGRIAIAAIIYFFLALIFLIVYAVWVLIPIALLLYAARSL